MKITKETFGKHDGKDVFLFCLENDNDITIKITNYGGIITHILTPDKDGNIEDINLGFDTMNEYLQAHPYFGCIVGRYANRISKGRFTLNGKEYHLAINNGPNSLHGGLKGFDKAVWDAEIFEEKDEAGIILHYLSKDMEEGYPGNLQVEVYYSLTNNNDLIIEYKATTDKDTVINLTNHAYFNLTGCKESVHGHDIQINAENITDIDTDLIPTGKILPVEGTPLDLRKRTNIGIGIANMENGYDNNFVLDHEKSELILAARVWEPKSGRMLEVQTTEPGIQFYTGNFLDGTVNGKGLKYEKQYGFCLEAQHYPDSPNKPEFPSTVLKPGETYNQTTIYHFGIE
jgi:aldose 1-epimerase